MIIATSFVVDGLSNGKWNCEDPRSLGRFPQLLEKKKIFRIFKRVWIGVVTGLVSEPPQRLAILIIF
jgi:hypothetical protein